MTDLTEQWKEGELEEGYYYIKGIKKYDGINVYFISYPIHETERRWIKEVLAPVPSYDDWVYLHKARNDAHEIVESLTQENTKLKELLKECRDEINPYIEVIGGKKTFKNLIDKISEVLE